jgi:raffinose/stachyose/melibiose transport system permease protein
MERLLKDKVAILVFVLPAALIYLFSVFVPICWSTYYSLFSGLPGINFKFVGLSNFAKMWSDRIFLGAFGMNMAYVAIVVVGQVGLGLLLSLLFMFGIRKYKTLVRTIVFFPVVLPVVAVGQLFSKIFEITPTNGLFNSLLVLLGLGNWVQPWLGQPTSAFLVLCFMDIWTAMGFYAIIFYAALMDIPTDIIEAAHIDGANGFRLLKSVLLPSLRPITLACLIFSFTGTLKVFESSLALTRGGPGTATKTLSMYMYDSSFLHSQYGYGSAIAVFILIECVVITAVLNGVLKSRES